MFDNLIALGYGIIVFAILIGVGSIVLFQFGGSVGCESTDYPSWNSTAAKCVASDGNVSNTTDPTGAAYTNVNYMLGQLGESGLAGWTPAIIAISVGLLFLGAFMIGRGRVGRY